MILFKVQNCVELWVWCNYGRRHDEKCYLSASNTDLLSIVIYRVIIILYVLLCHYNWFNIVQMSSFALFRYSMYVPLHELWKGYIEELFKGVNRSDMMVTKKVFSNICHRNPQALAQKILKADLHGCLIAG